MTKVFLILLIGALAAFATLDASGYSTDWFERGKQQYAAGQYAGAVSDLSQAVAQDPSNDLAHYLLANALLHIGNTSHAMQEYQRALTVARTPDMISNCTRALQAYHVSIPRNQGSGHIEGPVRSRWRQSFPAPTVSSVQELNSLAGAHRSSEREPTDSHPDGVAVFKAAPEHIGSWDRWIADFRMAFEAVLARDLGPKRSALYGRTQMVFSVDARHTLRGRIVNTDAPPYLNASLLSTTRRLDGSSTLSFPNDTAIGGFNFTMGWNYGQRVRSMESVSAAMTNTNANLRNPAGARAVAGQLGSQDVNGQLVNKNASGQMIGKQASGQLIGKQASGQLLGKEANGELLGKQASGQLLGKGASAEAAGSLMPSFSTDLSGIVLPKPKPQELKASPAKSLDETKK